MSASTGNDAYLDAEWYHGHLSREECERIMYPRETGKFLVRESSGTPGQAVLTVCGPIDKGYIGIENYLINRLKVGKSGATRYSMGDRIFDGLCELVHFCKTTDKFLACKLEEPYKRKRNLANTGMDNGDFAHSQQNSPAGGYPSLARHQSASSWAFQSRVPPSYSSVSNNNPWAFASAQQSVSRADQWVFDGDSTYSDASEPSSNAIVTPAQQYNQYGVVDNNSPTQDTPDPSSGLQGAYEFALSNLQRDGWILDPCMLNLHGAHTLGGGEFGEVLRGELRQLPPTRQYPIGKKRTDVLVAVKKLRSSDHLTEFYSEAMLMTKLCHTNLVGLIGVVRSPLRNTNDPFGEMNIVIVTEYCAQGDLVSYLRSRGRSHVTSTEQLRFAMEVCTGMRFLEKQRVVHRDLAARNVLLDDELTCKVSDFGLARRINNDGSLAPAGERTFAAAIVEDTSKFPTKWTAPEAIQEAKYSTKSDMWSFGVLLWEIYSFGLMPYKRLQANEVLTFLQSNRRMECPKDCPRELYDVMKSCWDINPDKRPTFDALCNRLFEISRKVN